MNSETKNCQNCKKDFIIEPDDFAFYERMKVPAPTWCPECRMRRRLAFRDFRVLYKRKSDWNGETIFSIFPKDSPYKVYENAEVWQTDKWDPMQYGQEYDFSKPFFEQIKELSLKVPQPSQTMWGAVNSDYCTGSNNLKNCYLVFVATSNEDCMYSSWINRTKNSIDVTKIESSDECYESFGLIKSHKAFFSSDCEDCVDVWFSKNLQGCMNCLGCVNLRNKQYYIFNQPYSKKEYEKKFSEFDLGSFKNLENFAAKAEDFFSKNIVRYVHGKHNFNVSGEYINNSKNVHDSYYVYGAEDCRYVQYLITPSIRDCMDLSLWGENSELIYEVSSCGDDCSRIKLSYRTYRGSHDCTYCMQCMSSSNLFGCVGLQKKQYCILNKQYTKEEYEAIVPKIIEHMNAMPYTDKKGRVYKYGEFFPPEFSFFAYNETLAFNDFPLTKEEAIAEGYKWKESEEKDYKITLESESIPDNIKGVTDEIMKESIGCVHKSECQDRCTVAFKITKQELDFYRANNIPVPRLCHNCRHVRRVKNQSPLKLWHRKCQCTGVKSENGVCKNSVKHSHGDSHCPNEFKTNLLHQVSDFAEHNYFQERQALMNEVKKYWDDYMELENQLQENLGRREMELAEAGERLQEAFGILTQMEEKEKELSSTRLKRLCNHFELHELGLSLETQKGNVHDLETRKKEVESLYEDLKGQPIEQEQINKGWQMVEDFYLRMQD
ncbi:MAG: hypothetical protein NTW30_01325, partial [Candidatus Aenigmarchaeota archaeon]|nr:hypothetical protein [Candidatus Aenigmarchaeota archaeon]